MRAHPFLAILFSVISVCFVFFGFGMEILCSVLLRVKFTRSRKLEGYLSF